MCKFTHTYIFITYEFGKCYLFFITSGRIINYLDLHKKCSIKVGERGIDVLEVDASAGVGDVLGALWEDFCPVKTPAEYLRLEGKNCAK